jgi:hypothetical protein
VAVLILGILFSPATNPESRGRLTTFAADPAGTRGLYETAARLGWPVSRRIDRMQMPLDTSAIYVLLRPAVELTSSEAAALFDAVRKGAGLLLVPEQGSALTDSLGVKVSDRSFTPYPPANPAQWDSLDAIPSIRWPYSVFELSDSTPDSAVVILAAREFDGFAIDSAPVVLGVPLGRGRIVMIADGTVVSNVVFREGFNGVLPIRLLEWLAPGRRPEVIFAEFHQGYGRHPSVTRAIRNVLVKTPPGRVLFQLLVASAVLLLAVGIRPIAPRSRARLERRSPIEHVDALAHAYAQVGATRTATRRLVHGLRRRHPIGTLRQATDAEYLTSLAARHPTIAPQVELLATASTRAGTADDLREAGVAVAHIERILTT